MEFTMGAFYRLKINTTNRLVNNLNNKATIEWVQCQKVYERYKRDGVLTRRRVATHWSQSVSRDPVCSIEQIIITEKTQQIRNLEQHTEPAQVKMVYTLTL